MVDVTMNLTAPRRGFLAEAAAFVRDLTRLAMTPAARPPSDHVLSDGGLRHQDIARAVDRQQFEIGLMGAGWQRPSGRQRF